MYNIALFTSEKSLEHLDEVLKSAALRATIHPYVVTSYDSLMELFEDAADSHDGFLFSGWIIYSLIAAVHPLTKPFEVFHPTEGDFYRTLTKAMTEHPEIPITRMLSDNAGGEHGFTDVIPKDNHPILLDTLAISAQYRSLCENATPAQAMNFLRGVYLNEIQAVDARLVISGLARLETDLKPLGIPFYHIFPGKDSMENTIDRLINRLESGNLSASLSVGGVLSAASLPLEILRQKVSAFSRHMGLDVLILEERDCLRLLLSKRDLACIHPDQKDDLLARELLNHEINDFSLGWGIGYDIAAAYKKARRAHLMARRYGNAVSFLITEIDSVKGPLLGEQRLEFSSADDDGSAILSYQYDISRLHIRQIRALIEKEHDNLFTGDSLAAALNLHPRSARRILAKLAQNGGAELIKDCAPRGIGRPQLQYRITLH